LTDSSSTGSSTGPSTESRTAAAGKRTKGDYLPGDQVPPKSPGKLATKEQLAEIHILKVQTGWPDWPHGEEHFDHPKAKWPTYRAAIGAYKKLGGGYCHHSNELQEHQADNLIKRMRAAKARQDETLAKGAPLLKAVMDDAELPDKINHLMQQVFVSTTEESEWCLEVFGIDSPKYLDTETSKHALQLLLAKQMGDEAYRKALAEYREER
jgi:hypothetical protein